MAGRVKKRRSNERPNPNPRRATVAALAYPCDVMLSQDLFRPCEMRRRSFPFRNDRPAMGRSPFFSEVAPV